ncbi:hypothetical protein ACFGVS_01035 [Mucilaginibacter sp. AW1-7]|uniref:hypothetical protein n=1 Tax=Mucilaginibacter sp. AW1-7 TaxID=3349874 RepID=UPI003F73660D
MKKIAKVKITLLIAAALTGLALLGRAVGLAVSSRPAAPRKTAQASTLPVLVYDTLTVGKFNSLLRSMDYNKVNCLYAGSIDVTDGKDSANNVRNLKFLFNKRGKTIYYLLGRTETLNQDGLNIFIDHENQKIALSNEHFEAAPPVKSTTLIISQMRSENYSLLAVAQGASKKISIRNERHVTCKELSVTYDTLSNKLQQVYSRFTDITDIPNTTTEKQVRIRVDRQEDRAEAGLYPVAGDVVRKANGKWALQQKYASYELIIL